jgi:RND family efflux transporter MFP subunit
LVTKKKKIIVMVALLFVALSGLITYRIYANLSANKERAGRLAQGRVVEVEAARVGRQDVNPVIVLSGSLEAGWSADISPKADGRIDKLYVEEGDVVKAGSVLADLDMQELQAQLTQAEGNLLVAKAEMEQADLELKRMDSLVKQGAISAQSYDTARIKRDLNIGKVKSAQGNFDQLATRLDNASILAPREGVVVKRQLQAGFFAKAGTPIISLADTSSLLAKATLGEGQISQVTVGAMAKVIVNALDGREFSGVITRISPAAALPARTFTAEISVPNPSGILKQGMFAKVELTGNVKKNVLVVPEIALVMREDQKTVYVINADNKVQQQTLKLGYVGNGVAEVLDGVKEGDQIVVAGQNKIKDGATVKASAKDGGQ